MIGCCVSESDEIHLKNTAIATGVYQQALLFALIRTHQNPVALMDEWRQMSAIATARWASSVIGKGDPELGKLEMTTAFRQINETMSEAVSNFQQFRPK